jgi:hypothetical protein
MRGSFMMRTLVAAAMASALLGGLVPTAGAFTEWTMVASPSSGGYGNLFEDVSARSLTDVWAVGAKASSSSNETLAAHWNGARWAVVATPNPVASCQDGNIQWTGNKLNAVGAVSAKDVWAVGHSCHARSTLTEHWNGTSWRIVPSPSFATGGDGIQNALGGVAAISSSDVWAVGYHTASSGAYKTLIEHWDGLRWSVAPSPSPSATRNVLNAVAATGPSDVWAVGSMNGSSTSLIEHWNGTSWSVVPSPALPRGSVLDAVVALSRTDAWAVGSRPASSGASATLVVHWNGSRWSVVPSPNVSTEYGSANVVRGVAAVSSSDVWAVGMFQNERTDYHQRRTLTLHWDGVGWRFVSSPTPGESGELNDAAALPTGQVWAAGLYSNYDIDIYDGTYNEPRTLVIRG